MNEEKLLKKQFDSKLDDVVPNPYMKKKRPLPIWAKIMIPVTAVALTASVAVPILMSLFTNINYVVDRLKGTHVNMENVAAFGILNPPEEAGKKGRLANIKYLNSEESEEPNDNSGDSSDDSEDPFESMTDEEKERYEWESEYDWDPDKASVLVTLDDEGKVTEVVYEMTNNQGIVRQAILGNCASIYVSKGFTYVMYVNDSEWDFYKDVNYAQELINPTGFHCHHDEMQTIVIHNETGKVFAVKDLMKQVSVLAGEKNYTMQVHPTKDDYLYISPCYGSWKPLWFKLILTDESELVYYYVIPEDSGFNRANCAHDDVYGQMYVLADDEGFDQFVRLKPDIVELLDYHIVEKTMLFHGTNSVMYGSDSRMYAFIEGKLQVFGENFTYSPVEPGTTVNFEGMANEFFSNDTGWLNGVCYHLEDNYLYSMFGKVWKIAEDGTYTFVKEFEGYFPQYANDGFMVGGEIIAFVETEELYHYSVNGKVIHMKFGLVDGEPTIKKYLIMDSTEYWSYGHRIVFLQDEEGGLGRGYTKFYLLTVVGGQPKVSHIVNMDPETLYGYQMVNAITEPIDFTN